MAQYFKSLLLIMVVLVQPVHAKLVEKSDLSTSHHSEVQYIHDGADDHVFECHSGHVMAIQDNYPITLNNLMQMAYELRRISNYLLIITEDPPPPKF